MGIFRVETRALGRSREEFLVKSENLKIVTISFLIIAFLAGFVAQVLFETVSVISGNVAQLYNVTMVRHGVPLFVGISLFLYFQFKHSVRKLADEVVTEVRKVTWPTKKELYSMTSVVCVTLVLSGLVLGLFDLIAGTVVQFFMES